MEGFFLQEKYRKDLSREKLLLSYLGIFPKGKEREKGIVQRGEIKRQSKQISKNRLIPNQVKCHSSYTTGKICREKRAKKKK